MSRELKFRAWNDNSKKWVQEDILLDSAFNPLSLKGLFVNQRDEMLITVQLFTGRFDDYGREIYEGDILRLGSNNLKAEVFYSLEEFCFICKYPWGNFAYLPDFKNVEVIGNIFENPNLLNDTET